MNWIKMTTAKFLLFSTVALFGVSLNTHLSKAAQVTAYVSTNKLNVRLCPRTDCPITNRVYRGAKVKVFATKGKWARVSKYYNSKLEKKQFPAVKGETVARWVAREFLSKTPPIDRTQTKFSTALMDPRIKGIPKVGENGLTKKDIELLRLFSAKLIRNGKCSEIGYGDKSVSKKNTYYVNCDGEPKNRFFTAKQAAE